MLVDSKCLCLWDMMPNVLINMTINDMSLVNYQHKYIGILVQGKYEH